MSHFVASSVQSARAGLLASLKGDKAAAIVEGVRALAYHAALNGGHLVVVRATVADIIGAKKALTAGTAPALAVTALKGIDSPARVDAGPKAGTETARHELASTYAQGVADGLRAAFDEAAAARKAKREAAKAPAAPTGNEGNEGATGNEGNEGNTSAPAPAIDWQARALLAEEALALALAKVAQYEAAEVARAQRAKPAKRERIAA